MSKKIATILIGTSRDCKDLREKLPAERPRLLEEHRHGIEIAQAIEAGSSVKPGFADEVLDSLSAHVAVLDAHGTIVAVNGAWRRYARRSGGDDRAFYLGASYLAACESAVRCGGEEKGAAEAVLQGIRDLLSGRGSGVAVEYPCHSPADRHWFVVHLSRFSYRGATYVLTAHEDITVRKTAEDKLRESEAILRNVLDSLPVGVWIMDQKGQIVHGNPAGQRIWEGARYVGPERFGEYKGWRLSTGRPIAAEEWAAARAIQKGETSIDEEIRIECFDGSSKIILNSATPLRDGAGAITGAIIVDKDITSRKQVEEELRHANIAVDGANRELQQVLVREQLKARTDELTGLSNRRCFEDLSRQLLRLSRRYRTPLSILLFDVDHFKRINDTYGHQVGDAILKRVARSIREHMRDADVVARYGGDEFIVTLPNTAAQDALRAAEHLRESVGRARAAAGNLDLTVTISAGVAEVMPDGDTLDRLVQRADRALYAAKDAGRNCCRVFSPAAG